MSNKKWTLYTLGMLGALLLFTALFVYIVDPFFQYHKPAETGYLINNEIYQNPGIAKNYDYDAVILGSSMCQNFKVSEFDEKYDITTVKLTYSGAYASNFKHIMDVVNYEKDVEKIFWGIDTYAFLHSVDETRFPLPEHLYDYNIFNDTNYIFNKDTIIKSIGVVYNQIKGIPTTSIDDSYYWYDSCKSQFVPANVMKNYQDYIVTLDREQTQNIDDYFLVNVQQNMEENILPIIENNPQAEIYIFYPPYSVLYWNTVNINGELESQLSVLEYITEVFLQYENITICSFQSDENIVYDISLYKDHTHYDAAINSFIIDNLDNPDYQVTKDNYKSKIDVLRELAENIDIDELADLYINTD